MITLVDYGVGNLASVKNMLCRAGASVELSSDPKAIASAEKLLLPGVGHFDHGMKMLNQSGLRAALDEAALGRNVPVLGICLGAQILGEGSEEGSEPGLGWIPMRCKRIPASAGIRVPHMGWNQIVATGSNPLFDAMQPDARFYFVHSYYMECADPKDSAATTQHGITFTAAVRHGRLFGTQFHPEKSLRHGLAVMRAFHEYRP